MHGAIWRPTTQDSLAEFFSQNFRRDSRQVCRPSAKIADKFVGLVQLKNLFSELNDAFFVEIADKFVGLVPR
jgi:hypothetical protein